MGDVSGSAVLILVICFQTVHNLVIRKLLPTLPTMQLSHLVRSYPLNIFGWNVNVDYIDRCHVLKCHTVKIILCCLIWSFGGWWTVLATAERSRGLWCCWTRPGFVIAKHSRGFWWRHVGKYTFSRCCILHRPENNKTALKSSDGGPWHFRRNPK